MNEANKSTLAKLLATENISVVQDKVSTASFDVKNRVLTLPMWADVSKHTEDHLIGHEVGHALFTPLEGWHDAVCDRGPSFKSYLNVVEDARIEKLIQRKYPGLRGSFIKSYRKLFADGFFGADLDTINKMGLIDRINTYFKCGMSAGVQFAADEKHWLPRIEKLETWEEVVALTEELFQFAKEQQEQKEQEMANDPDTDEDEEGDEDGAGMSGVDDFDDEEMDEFDELFSDNPQQEEQGEESDEDDDADAPESATTGTGEETASEQDEKTGTETGGEQGGRSDTSTEQAIESQTDKNLRDNIDREVFQNFDGTVRNWILPKASGDIVVDYKTVLADIRCELIAGEDDTSSWRFSTLESRAKEYSVYDKHFGNILFSGWYSKNKKAINLMVKEFEMRKSAAEFQRATISKSGVIDTIKMNNYKTSEDIFKKVTVVPEGKNHGFLMLLDMSGSMNDVFYDVVKQTLLMTMFCRQINVPFRVYGFSDSLSYNGRRNGEETEDNSLQFNQDCRLIEIFNEKMSKSDLAEVAGALLVAGASHHSRTAVKEFGSHPDLCFYGNRLRCNPAEVFRLGGTPLDTAINHLIPIALEFRTKYRLDNLNTITLTDGYSHPLTTNSGWDYVDHMARQRNTMTSIRCAWNNKTYRWGWVGNRPMVGTELYLKMYKDITGSTVLGYFVQTGGKANFQKVIGRMTGVWFDDSEAWKKANKGEHYSIVVPGYDEMFIVNQKALVPVTNAMDEVSAGESKAKIRTAFKKSANNALRARKMLIDIVKRVA